MPRFVSPKRTVSPLRHTKALDVIWGQRRVSAAYSSTSLGATNISKLLACQEFDSEQIGRSRWHIVIKRRDIWNSDRMGPIAFAVRWTRSS